MKSVKIGQATGKRTKKVFTLNINVSRTSQKHSESLRVTHILGGQHSQVLHKVCGMQSFAKLLRVLLSYPEAIFLAKLCEVPLSNLTKYLSDFIYFLFNK